MTSLLSLVLMLILLFEAIIAAFTLGSGTAAKAALTASKNIANKIVKSSVSGIVHNTDKLILNSLKSTSPKVQGLFTKCKILGPGCFVKDTPVLMAGNAKSNIRNINFRNSAKAIAVAASMPIVAVPIQEVQLLDYAVAHETVNKQNNLIASTDQDLYLGLLNEDPYTSDQQRERDKYKLNDTDWYSVSFKQVDGTSQCHFALHDAWIQHQRYESDKVVILNLPEQGINGPFRITSIKHILPQKKPEGDAGDGYDWKPVTALFEHQSNQVYNIDFDNEEQLGVTYQHPIYSTTAEDWKLAGELEIGEEVLTKSGNTKVVSSTKKEGSETVYNLEVKELHNFLVGDKGVVVHNACVGADPPCYKLFKDILNDYRKKLDDLLGDKISKTVKDRLVSSACKVVNVAGYTIKWDKFGFPDFLSAGAVFNIGGRIANYTIQGMAGDNYHDYKKATDQMKIQFANEIANGSVVIGSDHRVTINGEKYTWHH